MFEKERKRRKEWGIDAGCLTEDGKYSYPDNEDDGVYEDSANNDMKKSAKPTSHSSLRALASQAYHSSRGWP